MKDFLIVVLIVAGMLIFATVFVYLMSPLFLVWNELITLAVCFVFAVLIAGLFLLITNKWLFGG